MVKPERLQDSKYKNAESKLRLYLENKEYIINKPVDFSKWRSKTPTTRSKKMDTVSAQDNYKGLRKEFKNEILKI